MKSTILIALLLVAASATQAQTQIPYDKVLVPVFIDGTLPGANGSQWTSELAITNRSNDLVFITGVAEADFCGQVEPCGPQVYELLDHTTVYPTQYPESGLTYSFIGIQSGTRSDVAISLRFADQSRQLDTWGTSIPVVYESDALAGTFTFVPVPSEEQSRVTLRVYDFQPDSSHGVTVRLYKTSHVDALEVVAPDILQAERHVSFFAGYIEIPLASFGISPPPTGTDYLRLDVIPDDSQKEYWGIVSITNNDTQHATVILPQ